MGPNNFQEEECVEEDKGGEIEVLEGADGRLDSHQRNHSEERDGESDGSLIGDVRQTNTTEENSGRNTSPGDQSMILDSIDCLNSGENKARHLTNFHS